MILLVTGLFFLLLHIPGGWKNSGNLVRPLAWLPLGLTFPIIALGVLDTYYYTESGRHLSYEVLQVSRDEGDMGASLKMMVEYRWSILSLVLLAVVLFLLWRVVLRPLGERHGTVKWTVEAGWFLVYFVVLIFGLKGTVSGKPIRMVDAFSQGRTELGHLVLNPAFTVGRSLQAGNAGSFHFLDRVEALDNVHDLLDASGVLWEDAGYPLYRSRAVPDRYAKDRPNLVVLIMLESWSARYVGSLGYENGITPRFDELASEGLLFNNFYAVGSRTIEGLGAVNMGIPSFNHHGDLIEGSVLSGSLEQNRFVGLGEILARQGYRTLFLHGESSGKDRIKSFARMIGVEKHLGREELGITREEADSAWGAWDHAVLDCLYEVVRKERQPFFALWLSLTNHPPYDLPDDTFRTAGNGDTEGAFQDTIRYTDHHLGRFFERARLAGLMENTIFIVTADHAARSNASLSERYHIPLLIIAPGRVDPGVSGIVGTQLDIVPTVLDLLGITSPHHAMGQSLLRENRTGFAYLNFSQGYGWIEDGKVLTVDPEGEVLRFTDLDTGQPLTSDPGLMKKQLLSFIQVSWDQILENRLAPKR
ncbi:MAG: LTA synthase family protein [bacterium]|nr:LTA synthase family protein [bacterium]